jgi:hypothetical protein
MPFLGKTPAQGFVNSVTKDDFTPNGSTTAFTLSKSPATVNEIEVYVGNVRQEPTSAYSVSGTALTMTEAPATGTNFYVMHIGNATQSSTTLPGGSTVPGDFDVSGQLGVARGDTNSASAIFTSNNTANAGSIQPAIKLIRTEKHPSGTVLRTGGLRARMTNTSDAEYSAWEAEGNVLDNTAGSEDAYFRIRTVKNGTLAAATKIDQDGILFDQSGAGIYLGTTSKTDANKLDDYEEGTWTPEITIDNSTTGITYATKSASYIKVGKMVFVEGDISMSSKGSGSGTVKIQGLPFTVYDRTGGTSLDGGSGMCAYAGGITGVFSSIGIVGVGGGTVAALYISTTSGGQQISNLTDSKITNTFGIRFSLTYREA